MHREELMADWNLAANGELPFRDSGTGDPFLQIRIDEALLLGLAGNWSGWRLTMESVGVSEARTRLSRLLAKVVRGERFTITRHGVPVAVLAPIAREQKANIGHVIAAIKRFRSGRKLRGPSLRDMIREGRRF